MKSSKTIVRIIAVVMVLALSAGLVGCVNSYNTNPIVAKVGGVELDLNRFYSLYNNTDTSANPYYSYLQYGAITREQYANYIIEDLVNYGVQLDQVAKQKITLDEEEEAKLQQDVDDQIKEYAVSNYGSKVDAAITDETAKAEAAIALLKEELENNKTNFEEYRKSIEDSLRNNALIEKLRKINIGEINVTTDEIKKYYEENATSTTVSSFRSAFQNFTTDTTHTVPLFMPHPEKEVMDDSETTDTDEHKDADEFGDIFSVQHLLLKFETEASGDDAKDLTEYASKDEEFIVKMAEFEATLPQLSTEQFLEKCHDKDLCGDPGMLQPVYQYFGYMMQKDLVSSYYDGFGYAAMQLMFNKSWEPETETSEDAAATEAPEDEDEGYKVTYFTLSDNNEVARVYTNAGVHYIIINPNDWTAVYDSEGYFMLPIYENGELVTDGEGIVTANGHMTQEQFDAANEVLSHVQALEETEEEVQTKDSDSEETAEQPADEENEPVTLKTIFDYVFDARESEMESDAYSEVFKTWKDSTKITIYRNILKPFMQS